MSKPTVILMGAKPGATVALEQMIHRGWRVHAVVPSGKHDFIPGERLQDVSKAHNIPTMKQAELPDTPVDFVISYMFRNMVSDRTRALAKRAALNFHAAPLPEFGGWAFYSVAILEQVKEYGVTCHHMDDGFDTGPLLQVNRFSINAEEETAWSLERKAQESMLKLFVDFMELAESGRTLPSVAQDPSAMRYLKKPEFERLKVIPEDADDEQIQRTARAFFCPPYDCAYIKRGEARIEVLPRAAKESLTPLLFQDDLSRLRHAATSYAKGLPR